LLQFCLALDLDHGALAVRALVLVLAGHADVGALQVVKADLPCHVVTQRGADLVQHEARSVAEGI